MLVISSWCFRSTCKKGRLSLLVIGWAAVSPPARLHCWLVVKDSRRKWFNDTIKFMTVLPEHSPSSADSRLALCPTDSSHLSDSVQSLQILLAAVSCRAEHSGLEPRRQEGGQVPGHVSWPRPSPPRWHQHYRASAAEEHSLELSTDKD